MNTVITYVLAIYYFKYDLLRLNYNNDVNFYIVVK